MCLFAVFLALLCPALAHHGTCCSCGLKLKGAYPRCVEISITPFLRRIFNEKYKKIRKLHTIRKYVGQSEKMSYSLGPDPGQEPGALLRAMGAGPALSHEPRAE